MKLETFFEKFELIADAPDSVIRMREFVLALATTGRLVAQLDEDEPASMLVQRIERNINTLRIRQAFRGSQVEPLNSDGLPAIPRNWEWVRLGNVVDYGSSNRAESSDIPENAWLLDLEDIEKDTSRLLRHKKFRDSPSQSTKTAFSTGDVLYGKLRPYLNKVIVADAPGYCTTEIAPIRAFDFIESTYLCLALRRPEFIAYANSKSYGMNLPRLGTEDARRAPFPLPPLAEQKRIVAKVDELMALCDQLEVQQRERTQRHLDLARASVARFTEDPTPANLEFIFHKSYPIPPSDLRKTILTLAVQGKLVPQDPNDEPTADLLSRSDECRKRIALGDHRADEERQQLLSSEDCWETPETWLWRGMADLVLYVDYRGKTPTKTVSGVRLLTAKNVKKGLINLSPEEYLSENEYNVWMTRGIPKSGDVLFTTEAPMGNAAVVDLTERFALAQRVICFQSYGALDSDFLVRQILCDQFQFILDKNGTGVTAKGIKASKLKQLPIAVPPLAEQRRIVAKVVQLMALVDTMEAKLIESRAIGEELLAAIVAELAGTEQLIDEKKKTRPTTSMKSESEAPRHRRSFSEPVELSTRKFVLRRFAMTSGYRSLDKFDCRFHEEQSVGDEASPICLVGLNGSGKSNLIEAIAEVFCFLELINMPWQCMASDSSTYRKNRHRFEVEYTVEDSSGLRQIRIRKGTQSKVEFLIVNPDGTEEAVNAGQEQLNLLPRRIIGYSSGLNETISHPFLRTKTLYSQEARDAAPPEGQSRPVDDAVFDTRTLYMDYESNAAIIISNYFFRNPEDLADFKNFTRVTGVTEFRLRFNRKRAGKSGPNKIVRLTRELSSYLESFVRCAGEEFDEDKVEYDLAYKVNSETIARFHQEFKTAENLFLAMNKWSLLNALILSDKQRNVYLSSDITKGALERPPSVPPSDRVFDIVDLKLRLSEPPIEIDYSGLSDGEHQFIQVFGTVLLFSQPGVLFLFDEPESHFNPEWRTRFNLTLNRLPNASHHEFIVSTHSPFVVSGSRTGNVFKFARKGAAVNFEAVDFDTYGAPFDELLRQLFSIRSLIDESARERMEQTITRGDLTEMQEAVDDFAESKEKRRLYEAIIRKEDG